MNKVVKHYEPSKYNNNNIAQRYHANPNPAIKFQPLNQHFRLSSFVLCSFPLLLNLILYIAYSEHGRHE